MTREERLQWIKERALTELEHEGVIAGYTSMISDLNKDWDGEYLYGMNAAYLQEVAIPLGLTAVQQGPDAVAQWIKGFN